MLHFLSAPAYSGKTTALYELTRRLTGEGRRVLFFVPEQQTAATEADLVRLCGGGTGEELEVTNFQRLSNIVFRRIGGLKLKNTSPAQKALLLSHVLQEEGAHLPLFAKQKSRAPFVRELSSFFDELRRGGMNSADLYALSEHPALSSEQRLREKLDEAALAFAAYDAAFSDIFGQTPDDERRLIEVLSKTEKNLFENTVVILDGFYDFTAPQYELIVKMAEDAEDVYLSLLENENDPELFYRPCACRNYLKSRLEHADYEEITPADLGFAARADRLPDDLVFLCEHILKNPKEPFESAPSRLSLTTCRTPYDEVVFALKELLRLHEEEGVPFSDCAVLWRDSAVYAPLFRTLASLYRIPIYTEESAALSDCALALCLESAARIASGEEDARTFTALLSSGLMPLSEEARLYLERYIHTWNLKGDTLYLTDDYSASVFGLAEMILPSMREENEAVLRIINREKGRVIKPLLRLKNAFQGSGDTAEKTEALLAFAEETHVAAALAEDIDRLRQSDVSAAATQEALFDACVTALTQLADLHLPATGEEYTQLLNLALSFFKVGALPSSPCAMAAGDVSFVRVKKVSHLFLLGLNSEVFPREKSSVSILSVRERERISPLGEKLPFFFAKSTEEASREEYFLFYLAASVPRDGLHLTYSLQTLSGENTAPSVFCERVRYLFPHLKTDSFDAAHSLAVTPEEVYDYLFSHTSCTDAFTCGARALLEEASLPLPPTDGETDARRDRISPTAGGEVIHVSQAKLAAYAKCPYSYFLQYKLFLQTPPESKTDASLRGTLIHSALEHLLYPLSQGRLFQTKLSDLTDKAVEEEFASLKQGLWEAGFASNALSDAWFDDLCRSTKRLVYTVREELSLGTFRPALFEADLSRTLSPIERTLSRDCRMKISGKADRIDLAADPVSGKMLARVIDYKTGTHPFDATRVYNGFDLQLLLYLFTLQENGIPTHAGEVIPAGAYYLHSYGLPSSLTAAEQAKRVKNADFEVYDFTRSGIFLSEEGVISAMLPADAADERNFTPITYSKQGVKATSGLLADREEFDVLKEAVLKFAADCAEDILDGRFERIPLCKNEEENESCEYCPFFSICRYDGEKKRYMGIAGKDTLFEKLKEGGIHRG